MCKCVCWVCELAVGKHVIGVPFIFVNANIRFLNMLHFPFALVRILGFLILEYHFPFHVLAKTHLQSKISPSKQLFTIPKQNPYHLPSYPSPLPHREVTSFNVRQVCSCSFAPRRSSALQSQHRRVSNEVIRGRLCPRPGMNYPRILVRKIKSKHQGQKS